MSIDASAGGAGRGAASLLHRNRDVDFPDWVGRDLHTLGYNLRNLTRDGATSAGVLRDKLPLLGGRPDLESRRDRRVDDLASLGCSIGVDVDIPGSGGVYVEVNSP